MTKKKDVEKEEILRKTRCLNPNPERVRSKVFHSGSFFDPRDLVQVKYEMLREGDRDGASVSKAAADFGMSRPTFYQAKTDFELGGIPALSGQKRGPRSAHKVTAEIFTFIESHLEKNKGIDSAALSGAICEHFSIKIHPRTIERAIERKKKQAPLVNLTK